MRVVWWLPLVQARALLFFEQTRPGRPVTKCEQPTRVETPPPPAQEKPPPAAQEKRPLGTALREFEEMEVEGLEVVGRVPRWLRGSYVRNGPGRWNNARHLFDGFAYLCKIDIVDGEDARVKTRYLDTKAYRYAEKTGRRLFSEFGSASEGFKELMLSLLSGLTTDNAAVSVSKLADGRYVASSETVTASYEFDVDTLKIVKPYRPTGASTGLIQTAHAEPRLDDPSTIVNIGTSLTRVGYHVFETSADDVKKTIAFIESKRPREPSWIHAFAVTRNYCVFLETPAVYNVFALAGTGKADHVTFDWKPQLGTWVHCVRLDSGKVFSVKCPQNLFVFHCANAFELEDDTKIAFDVAAFDDASIVDSLCLDSMNDLRADVPESRLTRLHLDLSQKKTCDIEIIDDPSITGRFCEFAEVSPAYKGRPYRYAYAIGARRPTSAANLLTKTDVRLKTTRVFHTLLNYAAVGEPIFVPSPLNNNQSEDDGVLLAVGHTFQGEAHLLILDAASASEVARVVVPYPGLPFGFHALFLPSSSSHRPHSASSSPDSSHHPSSSSSS